MANKWRTDPRGGGYISDSLNRGQFPSCEKPSAEHACTTSSFLLTIPSMRRRGLIFCKRQRKKIETYGSLLSRAQRELDTKLSESLTVDNKPTSPGLLEKMKDLFN